MTTGYAAPIVELYEGSKNNYKLNQKVLEKTLGRADIAGKKIALISIAGPFRKGKSFLLNFLVTYLGHLHKGGKGEWFDEATVLDKFNWRGGADRDTNGIFIWSTPYMLEDQNGEEEEFSEQLDILIPSLFEGDYLEAKKINGKEITCREMAELFKELMKIFNSDDLPEPKTILEATADAVNLAAEQRAREAYDKHMKEVNPGITKFTSSLADISTLLSLHQAAETQALGVFSARQKLGEESAAKANKDNLVKYFATRHEEYKRTVQQNIRVEEEKRKIEAGKRRIAAEQEAERQRIKVEEERIRREKAENERRHREEAERLRKQREENERRQSEEQARIQREREELTRRETQVAAARQAAEMERQMATRYSTPSFSYDGGEGFFPICSRSNFGGGSSSGGGRSDGIRETTFMRRGHEVTAYRGPDGRFCKKPSDWGQREEQACTQREREDLARREAQVAAARQAAEIERQMAMRCSTPSYNYGAGGSLFSIYGCSTIGDGSSSGGGRSDGVRETTFIRGGQQITAFRGADGRFCRKPSDWD
ncbi:hypothetical protein WR25_02798 [Diploscapter pachys]|uniref:GB1/RHD3-type G domain-containing protein n=1 Tax=Diploscapter pachys TaxID=2018661 RepID=A0A2A2LYL7_9BILA|nr:hypothetical protein WR25_02798 [Diploscapter pachys]